MTTIAKEIITKPAVVDQGRAVNLSINEIDFSPLNYRKYFRQEDLETFAEQLKVHGIISPLTVRKGQNGKYELVAGERRLRAAKIAKLQTVPVMIRELTDEEVTEIQLAENLQRENPHPLDEANAVKLMKDTGKSMKEISLRLGKPEQYVYVRLKLLNLIESIREMFFGEVINLQQSLTIATISQDGQTAFFEEHCTKWKQKGFALNNLEWYLRPYRYDLRNAPFNTKDKKLIPEVGACTGCQFNSASVKSLFPDYAKQAVCSNVGCYNSKCTASLRIGLINGLQEFKPVALLFNGLPSEKMVELLKLIPEAENLTKHDYNEITVLEQPEEPLQEDFMYDDDEGGEKLDRKELYTATQNYRDELKAYEKDIKSGKYEKGLLEKGGEFFMVYFNLDKPRRNTYDTGVRQTTMKVVQEAIKTGTATAELLDSAIDGIRQREARAKEIDRDKVQKTIHQEFEEKACDPATIKRLTDCDKVGARLLVYQSLDYSSREKVNAALFKKVTGYGKQNSEKFYEALKALTDQQYSYMIRMALAGKSDSKFPNSETGVTLYRVAEAGGIDVKKIEADQQGKADARAGRVKDRVKDLQKRKSKLAK